MPRQNPAAQTEITPRPQLQSNAFITRPAFPTRAQCVRVEPPNAAAAPGKAAHSLWPQHAEPAGRVLQVTRLRPKPQQL